MAVANTVPFVFAIRPSGEAIIPPPLVSLSGVVLTLFALEGVVVHPNFISMLDQIQHPQEVAQILTRSLLGVSRHVKT